LPPARGSAHGLSSLPQRHPPTSGRWPVDVDAGPHLDSVGVSCWRCLSTPKNLASWVNSGSNFVGSRSGRWTRRPVS
jgi:hypothetical protein